MSYINVDVMMVPFGTVETTFHLDDKPLHSFTDGEELIAAKSIIALLDDLDNNEYLIISRDIF